MSQVMNSQPGMSAATAAFEKSSHCASARCDVKLHPRLLLQVADHAEQVLRLRIAARTKHADQTFRRCAGCGSEPLESDRRLDVIAENRLSGFHVAGEHRIDALAQQRLRELGVVLNVPLDQFPKTLCFCHMRLHSG